MISEEALGERVRAARARAGLSQSQLADAIGVDQPSISRIEAGRDIGSIQLARIAKATGEDYAYFLRPEEAAEPRVLLRPGNADGPAIQRAVRELDRFVRDYEFLIELTAD